MRLGSAGAAFEVALECDRMVWVGELDRDNQPPGTVLGCVTREAGVVSREADRRTTGQSYVVSFWILRTLEDVDETSVIGAHGSSAD